MVQRRAARQGLRMARSLAEWQLKVIIFQKGMIHLICLIILQACTLLQVHGSGKCPVQGSLQGLWTTL